MDTSTLFLKMLSMYLSQFSIGFDDRDGLKMTQEKI